MAPAIAMASLLLTRRDRARRCLAASNDAQRIGFAPGGPLVDHLPGLRVYHRDAITAADGRVGVVWVRSQAVMGSASSKGVAILFDKDGKMIRVVNRNETKTN